MSAKVNSMLFAKDVSPQSRAPMDVVLIGILVAIIALGLVIMTSASVAISERLYDGPFHFFWRQSAYLLLGASAMWALFNIPLTLWNRAGPLVLLVSILLLATVIVPGVGKSVNGSVRWLDVGLFNFQVSEVVKLTMVIFMASYLARHGERIKTSFSAIVMPLIALGIVGVLLLAEPDFGTTVVISATVLGLLLLAGMRLLHFAGVFTLLALALLALAKAAPYRWERITTFLNPWADPFNSGFQLSQSLIAFGRGELFGVGLGGSVQKLFYLPEAHTDFIFAVLAEELGVVGALVVIALFALLLWRTVKIALAAQDRGDTFAVYLAFGIGLWFTFQAYVNLGVNMGVLPTKGLTLPLMSYGGSSIVSSLAAIGLLLRIDYENRKPAKPRKEKRK